MTEATFPPGAATSASSRRTPAPRGFSTFGLPLFLSLVPLLLAGCSFHFAVRPPGPAAEETQATGIYHEISRGDTLWSISRAYGVPVEKIRRANNLGGDRIVAGDQLFIPGATRAMTLAPAPAEGGLPAGDAAPGEPAFFPAEPVPIVRRPAPPARTGDFRLAWPCAGSARRTENGTGLAITPRPGELVKAAQAGRIIYTESTRELGNTVVVNHGNGYFSIYGGNITPAAAKDTPVDQGGVLGFTARDASARSPALFFEIRKGTEAVDPAEFFDLEIPPYPVAFDIP